MKKLFYRLFIILIPVLMQSCSSIKNASVTILNIKNAQQKGSFELIENSAIGTAAVQRAPAESELIWNETRDMKPGWYRISFPATAHFQVMPGNLEELEPFIITVSNAEGDSAIQTSFTFKDEKAGPVSLEHLPEPLLNPTEVQTRHSSQPLWIGEKSEIRIAVRRPLLIIGNISLEKVPANECIRLSLKEEAPYNMFTDEKPVVFSYEIQNPAGKSFKGQLRLILKDVLDGSEQVVGSVPVNLKASDTKAGNVEFTPSYGAYRLTAETLNAKGKVLYRQQRNITYSPAIDSKDLPDSWPVAFHRHSSSPEMMPPVGIKWVRLWGGWGEMEPEPGTYNWSLMDANVRMAKKYGFRLLWVCHGIPLWALPSEVKDKPRAGAHYAPADMNRMRPFLRAFWDRYADAGVIGAVEIGNEPNAHPGWSPEKYAELARVVYEETHRATKGIKVVGISMSGGTHIEYMEKALSDGLDKNMDIASLHLYEISNPTGDRSIDRKTRLFMQKLKEHGLGKMPVWNTESGSSTDIRQDGVMLTQEELNLQISRHSDFDPSIPWRVGNDWRGASELLGTSWMIRACYQQFALGVKKNFIFQWSASPHYSWVYDWKPGGNPMPKIKVVATGVMSKMLLDYGPSPTPVQPGIQSKGKWLAFAHRFEGPKGRMTIVYVQPDLYAGSGDQVAALAAGDDDIKTKQAEPLSPWLRTKKPDPVSVRVPVEAGQVIVMDMFGKSRKKMNSAEGYIEIEATEVPQYIIEEQNNQVGSTE